MTDTLKQYLISRINGELAKRGIDISKVSYEFEDGETHDDVDEFDGELYNKTSKTPELDDENSYCIYWKTL